jgi:hypothetical protein
VCGQGDVDLYFNGALLGGTTDGNWATLNLQPVDFAVGASWALMGQHFDSVHATGYLDNK